MQIRAETVDGAPIPDLQLAVIDPGTGKMVEAHPAIDTAKLRDLLERRHQRHGPDPGGLRFEHGIGHGIEHRV